MNLSESKWMVASLDCCDLDSRADKVPAVAPPVEEHNPRDYRERDCVIALSGKSLSLVNTQSLSFSLAESRTFRVILKVNRRVLARFVCVFAKFKLIQVVRISRLNDGSLSPFLCFSSD